MKTKLTQRDRDKQWGELNRRLQKAARQSDWQQMKSIYFEQVDFLRKEKRDAFHVLKEAMRCDLMYAKSSGVVKKAIVSTARDDRVCPICSKLEGQSFTIDEALGKMPIPVKCGEDNCYCRCAYVYDWK